MLTTPHFTIEDKCWESAFFAKKWGLLKFIGDDINITKSIDVLGKDLTIILKHSDKIYDLIEFQISTSFFLLIMLLEDFNFRLVDSHITFKTLINKKKIVQQKLFLSSHDVNIRMYDKKDLNDIIQLTHNNLTKNPNFISRFKNLNYFESADAERYFELCISNSIANKNSFCSVLSDNYNKVKGYFIYEKRGKFNNLPIYKGILTVIEKDLRGQSIHLALQYYLFSQLKDSAYYIDNTTQLSNISVIKNHIKSQRVLENISLIFFRKNGNR
ncbi:MAG: hypothetical protein WKF85_01250 [Chitinophagaceae bacterium]